MDYFVKISICYLRVNNATFTTKLAVKSSHLLSTWYVSTVLSICIYIQCVAENIYRLLYCFKNKV